MTVTVVITIYVAIGTDGNPVTVITSYCARDDTNFNADTNVDTICCYFVTMVTMYVAMAT